MWTEIKCGPYQDRLRREPDARPLSTPAAPSDRQISIGVRWNHTEHSATTHDRRAVVRGALKEQEAGRAACSRSAASSCGTDVIGWWADRMETTSSARSAMRRCAAGGSATSSSVTT